MTMEQQLGDLLADGKITDDDAHAARTFALFLRESGAPGSAPGDQLTDKAFRARWLPYILGEADGPVEPESP